MQENISFGQWLKRRRKALDLTQAALARTAPCAVQTIRALEADELRPSRELAARLAAVLGLPTSDHGAFVAFARGRLDAVPPDTRTLDSSTLNLPAPHTPLVERAHDISTPVGTAPIAHPSGTVTFLFTDIEGSTQLWEHTPQAMHTALARHDDIMHESVTAAGGYVYKTIGDAFQAAFATSAQALAAALAAQRAFHTEAWGTPRPLRVRMALHTGVTEERAGDYAGPLLNRIARLMAAGHGGQILISAATHELVWDQLPPGVTLRNLGVHLLKDLIRPEPIFQVAAPDLPSDFPSLKTRGADRSNLPAQATPFIGREQEVEAVCLCMRDSAVRLLTLTGPGGTGKTRLALQSAAALHDTFPDGVWFVDLAPIQDATLVIAAIAQTLNIREVRSEVVTERLTSYLRDKQLLLLLDNFEQVLAASVLLGNLLGAAPQVKMLVTSRARLHLSAEHELPVPPLAVPDLHHLPSPDRLMQVDAVQLFVTRARAVQPDFQLTETNAQAVAAICIHLDGLPLAIELAAARSKLLAPRALLTRLGRRLDMLTGGTRDLALRHQTLRSTIDWSYALLDAATQTLFRRLGAFVGGWTVEAADAVCSATPEDAEHEAFDTLEKLAVLLDSSLVQQHPMGAEAEPRFTMLETLREYALEQVAASSEIEAVRRQHAIYYLGLAEVGAPKLQSTQWRMWQARLEAELENFRAALQWSLESGEAELGLRLGAALVGHWWVPAFLPEWYRQVQEIAVTTTSSLPPATRANILRHVGRFAFLQGDYARAMMLLEQGVVFCRETGDQSNLAATLMFLADVVRDMSDYARASMLYQESLDIYRQLDDTSSLAWLYHSWSDMAMQQGEDVQGLALSQEGLRLFRELDAKPGLGLALHLQGIFRQRQGDDASALACLAECLVLFKEVGLVMGTAIGLGGLAVVMITLGQRQPADSAQRIATTRRAIQLLGAAEALREASTCPLFQVQRKEFDRAIPVARAMLGEAAFVRAWADGRAMSLEEAMADALNEVG